MASNPWLQDGVDARQPGPGQSRYSNTRLNQTQRQVDEVVEIMKENAQRIQERDIKLDDLDKRSEQLSASASQFERQSTVLRKKMWWKNLKWTIFLALLVILIVVVIIVLATKSDSGSDNSTEQKIIVQNFTSSQMTPTSP